MTTFSMAFLFFLAVAILKKIFHKDEDVGQRITDEINKDPYEVERLRRARRDIREGRAIFPWKDSDDDD